MIKTETYFFKWDIGNERTNNFLFWKVSMAHVNDRKSYKFHTKCHTEGILYIWWSLCMSFKSWKLYWMFLLVKEIWIYFIVLILNLNPHRIDRKKIKLNLLTNNLQITLSTSHRIGVNLAHIPTPICLLNIFNVEVPGTVIVET